MICLSPCEQEQDLLARLQPDERDRACAIDRAFRGVTPPVESRLRSIAPEFGYSYSGFKTIYYRWKREGVMGCIDRRLVPDLWEVSKPVRVAAEVLEFWYALQLKFQRDTSLKAAHREFIRLWQLGKVPSLTPDCKVNLRTGLPDGCTHRNLSRYKLTLYQKKAVSIGKHSASALLPKVLTTRVGLQPGELIEFDDQEHDVRIATIGVNSKITRPAGFHSLDLASGCDTLQSFKPAILNADGSLQKLRQVDFEWFIVAYLTQIGYRADTGTTFVWELGTTKTGTAFLERMIRATGGHVQVRSSGLNREPALAGLFHGTAKGNPRVKGSRECWFRLFREECAALPAPTGMDRHHAPEGSEALQREARMLLAAMQALPPQRAELLRLPCLTWTQYTEAIQTIVRTINARTWHTLEGWEECGHVAHEWRFAEQSPWLPQAQYLALPDPQKQLFQALMDQTPELWRTRRLSPSEVWEPRRNELTKVSGASVAILLGPEHARDERVEDDLSILVQDKEISPTPLVFDAVLANGCHLTRRQKLKVYLNPFAPDQLEVCDENLRWLGTAPRVQRIGKMDAHAAHRRYGRIRSIAAQELAPVARLGAEITRRETERHTRNADVLSGAPITPEEHTLAADHRRSDRKLQRHEISDETIAAALCSDDEPGPGSRPQFDADEISALFAT